MLTVEGQPLAVILFSNMPFETHTGEARGHKVGIKAGTKHPTTTASVLSKSDNVMMTSEHQQSHPVPGCEIKVKSASRMCGNSLLMPTGGEEINHVTRHKSQL